MLLEINCGQPIDKIRQPQDLSANGIPDDAADITTARRWYKDQIDQGIIFPGLSKAILCCLQGSLNPDADFLDSEFCEYVEEKVLEPLEQEMQLLLVRPAAWS